MEGDRIICFGEILWDLLPSGRFLGGAPYNVAYHLSRLGRSPLLASAVGRDELGREACAAMRAAGLDTLLVAENAALPTGTVEVKLDAAGQASYRICENVAWDQIRATPDAGERPLALVYGSLSLRTAANRERLNVWREARPGLTVCDINLRAPYDDVEPLLPLIRGVDLLKLNLDEAIRLGGVEAGAPDLSRISAVIAEKFRCYTVCITMGGDGAHLWASGQSFQALAPEVVVRDTVGAGDAFCAALIDGVLRSEGAPPWQKLLERACRLGAFVASRDGAQPEYDAGKVLGAD